MAIIISSLEKCHLPFSKIHGTQREKTIEAFSPNTAKQVLCFQVTDEGILELLEQWLRRRWRITEKIV